MGELFKTDNEEDDLDEVGTLVDEYGNKWDLLRDKVYKCLTSTLSEIILKKNRSEDPYLEMKKGGTKSFIRFKYY